MTVRLDEFSEDEWRDIARSLGVDWTDEQWAAAWSEFQELKRRKAVLH